MKKRGLSTIVITLIIILISLVAVGIVWVVVRNVIQTGTKEVTIGQFTLDAKIKNVFVDNNSNNVSLIVKRNAGAGEFSKMNFVFSDGQGSEVITQPVSLNQLEERRFTFHLSILNVSNLISISIFPYIKQDEKEILGNILDKYTVSSQTSTIIPTSCTPLINNYCSAMGYVCGDWGNGSCFGNLNCGPCAGTCNASGNCVGSGSLYTQNFEGSFPPVGWTTGGSNATTIWHRNTTEPAFGTASAGSNFIDHSQKTYLSYNYIFLANGNVSFWWNVSSEANYDYLCFCLDKACGDTGCTCVAGAGGGTADAKICSSPSDGIWTGGNVFYPVNAGNHTFNWCYMKDSWTVGGADMGKLDNVVLAW